MIPVEKESIYPYGQALLTRLAVGHRGNSVFDYRNDASKVRTLQQVAGRSRYIIWL